jgi:hypothetical protein
MRPTELVTLNMRELDRLGTSLGHFSDFESVKID